MTVTRFSNQGDLQYDQEIERTLRRLRIGIRRNFENNDLDPDGDSNLKENEVMSGYQTLKELVAPI